METTKHIACQLVSLSVGTMQPQPMDEQPVLQVVLRGAEHSPEMMVEPIIEETEQRMD